MQVIFGNEAKEALGDRFTFLELDTFLEDGFPRPITAYAVIGGENMVIDELPMLDNHARLHNDMLKEYKKGNFTYCHQALEHLKGKWRKELDSFYEIFEARIKELETTDLPTDWNGMIRR